MAKTIFKISGMKCHSCAKIIKLELEEERGINSVDVDFNSGKAFLEFDSKETDSLKIKNKIEKLGYKVIEE